MKWNPIPPTHPPALTPCDLFALPFYFQLPRTSVAFRVLRDSDSTCLCLLVKLIIKFRIHGKSPASTLEFNNVFVLCLLSSLSSNKLPPLPPIPSCLWNFHQPWMCRLQHNVCMIENSQPLQTAVTQADLPSHSRCPAPSYQSSGVFHFTFNL